MQDFGSVLRFWFQEVTPAQWWKVDPAFDRTIAERFTPVHAAAVRGELWVWRSEAKGRLAEVIVLDQFSRNLFRGAARAFAADPMALALSQEAIAGGHDQALTPTERSFLYMPFMHSESAVIHEAAVGLFQSLGIESTLDFELRHKAIIDRFGRYPHRNAALGRESTDAEQGFLQQPGSGF